MAPKRPLERDDGTDEVSAPDRKRVRSGFKVGPDNLPDGSWKRKVQKIKKDLITKAKLKKQYAKIKAQEPPAARIGEQEVHSGEEDVAEDPHPEIHPERQAMLDAPEDSILPTRQPESTPRRRGHRKPGYFDKELSHAERKKAEAEASRLEFERREKERQQRMAERERHRRAMAKARSGGRNGQRKLGRESLVLLERVRRLVGEN